MNEDTTVKTGTTTVGIICRDGVVLAADKRATAGYLVANKKTHKINNITDYIAVTMAGTASDAQFIIKLAQAELLLKKIRSNTKPSVKEAANLMARMVYSNIRKMSMIPGISHFVLAGFDESGFYLYDIFPDGTIDEVDDYISSGSGSVMAYGVLETLYKKDMTLDEGMKLAVKCVSAAIQRDIASGNGVEVVTITKDGVKKVFDKEIDTRVQA
ncbi:MAG: proteasome subunit beta [Candidatus Woesearchaeota archaeon]